MFAFIGHPTNQNGLEGKEARAYATRLRDKKIFIIVIERLEVGKTPCIFLEDTMVLDNNETIKEEIQKRLRLMDREPPYDSTYDVEWVIARSLDKRFKSMSKCLAAEAKNHSNLQCIVPVLNT